MPTKLPISVFIIAVDEGDRIARTIASVRDWVDEVIAIDSGSSDDTVAASEKAGARVMYHAWPGYGLQKRFGEEQCRNDWLLNLDADEVVSVELAKEIQGLFATGNPAHAGYDGHIVEILPGEQTPRFFAHRVDAVRLYDRRSGRYSDSTVHDRVHFHSGTVGKLQNIIEHRSSRGIAHSLAKINRYSTMQAEDLVSGRTRLPFPHVRLLIEFPIGFFKCYILRGYILQGQYGFINAIMYGFSRVIRIAKYLELKRHQND